MSQQTKIQWCDATWNWSIGCEKVSPGCKHCYAEESTPVRVARAQGVELWGKGSVRKRAAKATFEAPLKWNEKPWVCDTCGMPRAQNPDNLQPLHCDRCAGPSTFHRCRIFSLSLGDWLDEAIPIETLVDALDVIRRCQNLDFLLLTKRPENWLKRMIAVAQTLPIESPLGEFVRDWIEMQLPKGGIAGKAPANVWIGTTVENPECAWRIPELLKIPAVCRFLSVEPMLGPVDLSKWLATGKIHWPIFGGESGHKARECNIDWIRSGVAQCKAAGVACFVKQIGAVPIFEYAPGEMQSPGKLKDKKGGDMTEWPDDLRIRQFPKVEAAR